MLFSERNRLRQIEEREAAGDDVWIDTFPIEALVKISSLWQWAAENMRPGPRMGRMLRQIFLSSVGKEPIAQEPSQLPAAGREAATEQILDLLEVLYMLAKNFSITPGGDDISENLNGILHSHRIAYKMIDGQMFPYRDDPVFASTIEPTIRLLVDKRFDAAQKSYRSALQEIRVGDAADAVTDAGRALQDTLGALGYEGSTIGRQLANAKKDGLLAGHDIPLGKALEAVINWASAERSETGDAHKDSNATLDDAWLAVQVIGALILRLASDNPRGGVLEI